MKIVILVLFKLSKTFKIFRYHESLGSYAGGFGNILVEKLLLTVAGRQCSTRFLREKRSPFYFIYPPNQFYLSKR
jgi:hypothetical protein